ncbi:MULTISPECIES: patatin-like phospholipase family protein [unclassified Carboxylicivirga]|uniref:patatin-like phospholipase family protein n=1 Tax=Carboxylicivirga TaxID=1628153 RepID=UPI003D356518
MVDLSKTALVLEGGGFRGMFTAGVLDAFQVNNLHFPYVVGVSAGAAYGISYVSKQYGRNKVVNEKYTADPRYMSWRNLYKKGNLFDWDFVYGEIPNNLEPFDFEAFYRSPCDFVVGVTDVMSGQAEYLQTKNMDRAALLKAITASSSLPFVSKMVRLNGHEYMDGGLADSIPVMHALNSGYERAVVVLTRNEGYQKKSPKFRFLIKCIYRKYPKLVASILSRAERYNKTLVQLHKLEQEGRVYIIRPQQLLAVSRIENNPQKLDALHRQGMDESEGHMTALEAWLVKG